MEIREGWIYFESNRVAMERTNKQMLKKKNSLDLTRSLVVLVTVGMIAG